jgi:rhamnose utilization protein RhaD (predicted bifunctional aldolase and dehydrogenase)
VNNRWIDSEVKALTGLDGQPCGRELSSLVYASRLIGAEADLALCGGGNTSIKGLFQSRPTPSMYVKASGFSMATIGPDGFSACDLNCLMKLRSSRSLTDEEMAQRLRACLLHPATPLPSIETLMHAFIDQPCIIHTHPSAILCLTNRENGESLCAEALGGAIATLPYANSGLSLALSVSETMEKTPGITAIVLMHHGLITWGSNVKEAYESTIDIVATAERFCASRRSRAITFENHTTAETARRRYARVEPMLRESFSLTQAAANHAAPPGSFRFTPLITDDILEILDSPAGRQFALSAPLTPCYVVLTKSYSLWIDASLFAGDVSDDDLRLRIAREINTFCAGYRAYIERHASRFPELHAFAADPLPRVIMAPGLGVICAGFDDTSARAVRDLTDQELRVKRAIHETGGTYRGCDESDLFAMEFRSLQQAKAPQR